MAGVGRDSKKDLNGLLQALNTGKQVRHFHTTRILCNKSETNSEFAIFQSLSSILLSKKPLKELTNNGTNSTLNITVWVYKLCTTQIEKTFVKYDSINKASKGTGPSRDSIQRYLNTNVPIKGFFYITLALL